MAIDSWKRIERSHGFQRLKTILRRLIGTELRLRTEINVNSIFSGGWWFTAEGLDQHSIVYSLGVGEDIAFDLSVIQRFGAEVHAFDPTPSSIDMLSKMDLPPQFHFHPLAITAEDGILKFYPRVKKDGTKSNIMYSLVAGNANRDDVIEAPAFSLSSIATRLGHTRIDLLKMDIEGAEYEVLEGLLASPFMPYQLLVEFHHRFPGIGISKTVDIIERLRNAGYKIFAISETGREVSFLRTD